MSDPWIRVHSNLVGKPIIARAVAALGINENEAIGLMVRFWGSVSQHVVNGYVREVTDRQIELWAGWTRKSGRFANFIRSAHLDGDGRVREWDDYAGKLEARRAKDRARKEEERARKSRGSHADNPQDVTLNSIPARANEDETIRNETNYKDSSSSARVQSSGDRAVRNPMEGSLGRTPHEAAPLSTDAPVRGQSELLNRLTSQAGRDALAVVLSAAANRVGVISTLTAMLDGMHPPKVEPAELEAALSDYVANGQSNGTFNAAHFRGYVLKVVERQARQPMSTDGKFNAGTKHPDPTSREGDVYDRWAAKVLAAEALGK